MRARVVRGGSWNNNRNNVRCAVRNRNNPDNFNNNIGFRMVLSHNIFLPEVPYPSTDGGRGEISAGLFPARGFASGKYTNCPPPEFGSEADTSLAHPVIFYLRQPLRDVYPVIFPFKSSSLNGPASRISARASSTLSQTFQSSTPRTRSSSM